MIETRYGSSQTCRNRKARRTNITLQRYLMKYLAKAPFPVGEIRPVLTLLHPGHEPQDVIRLEDFEG